MPRLSNRKSTPSPISRAAPTGAFNFISLTPNHSGTGWPMDFALAVWNESITM